MATGAAIHFTCIGNKNVSSLAEFPWARYLSWTRVLLAAAATAMAALAGQRFSPAAALLALFLTASIVGAARGGAQRGLLRLLALFADTVYFLIVVYLGGARMEWLAATFFLYLLAEALVFAGPVEIGVISAVSAIFCTVLPGRDVQAMVSM